MGKLLVIVPAFNEASVIGKTIKGIRHSLKDAEILVVNDGSSDTTVVEAKKAGAIVVSHPINRGLGGALGTGLYWAKERDIDYVTTFDADGQHDPDDILKVLKPILSGNADVVIGTRTKSGWNEIPWDRKIVLTLSNWLTWWLFGIKTTDSTSGLRAFNRKAIENIQIKTDQMEVSNEFFYEIKRCKLRLKEVPIKVMYTDYSRSKGQKNSNAFSVGVKLLLRLFR
ncbi:glycosyltransferase family 2 protein [Candidatus Collierbacteria bacterium]|nr:glycosyltransferase family 2 protein [Candidatus Collierbacteria bacterium]